MRGPGGWPVVPGGRLAGQASPGPGEGPSISYMEGPSASSHREAAAEALGWAWAHWGRVQAMSNPVGYLYRVGQSRTRRRREPFVAPDVGSPELPWGEPGLATAMADLTEPQRVAVLLVHGFGWTTAEVAEVLGVKATTVQTHVARAIERLRAALEVEHEH